MTATKNRPNSSKVCTSPSTNPQGKSSFLAHGNGAGSTMLGLEDRGNLYRGQVVALYRLLSLSLNVTLVSALQKGCKKQRLQ